MDSSLEAWVKQAQSKGYSDAQIRKLLERNGYSKQVLDEFFTRQKKQGQLSKPAATYSGKSFNAPSVSFSSKRIVVMILFLCAILVMGSVMFFFSKSQDISGIEPVISSSSIQGVVIVEMQVEGSITVTLPELINGELLPSDRSLTRKFKVSFPADGIFVNNNLVLVPSSIIPAEQAIKDKALSALNLLPEIPHEYRSAYATITESSKNLFIVWRQGETIISKGNILTSELFGNVGITQVQSSNSHPNPIAFSSEDENKFLLFFINKTLDYEFSQFEAAIKLNDKQMLAEEPVHISAASGAVLLNDNKVAGMLSEYDSKLYFIPASKLQSIVSE